MPIPVFLSALYGRFFIIQIPLACLFGALAHFGFAPYNQQWIVPLAVMGLFALLHGYQDASPKKHFQLGLSFGFGLFITGLRWVHVSLDSYGGLPLIVTLLLMVLLALYLALYPALACYILGRFKHEKPLLNVILFSSAWVICEYLRGVVLTGFPWLSLGYSQTQGLFSPLASVFGVLGLTALICLLATLGFYALGRSKLSIVALIAVFIGGQYITSQPQLIEQDESVNLALVQGNIKQSAKWDATTMWPTITRYMDLSRKHFDSDVIIWPEAAMPAVEGWVSDYLKLMDSSASFNDSAIITGIIGRTLKDNVQNSLQSPSPKTHDYFNAIMTVGNPTDNHDIEGIYQPNHSNRYYKHQLLPVGEFVPFEALLRPLAPLFNLPMSSFSRGTWAQDNLVARGFKFAPAICYEIAFGELVRANMKADSNFLLTISNDAWFGESIGPHQHMQIAQMRAIELGRPLIRVTNTGITAIVNTDGSIAEQLPQFKEAVLRAKVNVVTGETFYYQHGQTPVVIFFLALLIIAGFVGHRHCRLHQKIALLNNPYSLPKH
jgi:apolipoprotein N-acyltransferase